MKTFSAVVVALLTLLVAAPVATAHSGLVAAYGFEEPSGTSAVDSSGAGATGTLAGATRSAAGRFGSALSFNGSGARVNVNDSASLDLAVGMTLEAWVKPTAVTDWRTVLLKERPGGLAYALYSSSDNNRPMAEIAASNGGDTRGTAGLASGVWTHLTTTYDGATLRFYVNGTQVSSRAISGAMALSSGALRIGGNAVWGEYFSGLIDEVRVYNRALTAGEIQLDMGTAVVADEPDTPPDATGPTAATLTASRTGNDVSLSWTESTDPSGVKEYRILRNGTLHATVPATQRTFDDVDVPVGTRRYSVRAVDNVGNVGPYSNEQVVVVPEPDGDAPTAPVLTATVTSDDVRLSWTESRDDVGVKEYRVYRDGALIATRTARDYDDSDRPTGSYRYKVVAVDNSGHTSPDSNEAEAVIEPDTTPPTASVAAVCNGTTVADYITLRPTYSDDRGPVTVSVEVDGEVVRAPQNTGTASGAFYFDWETRDHANGTRMMTVVARDAAGNETESEPCEWNVHNPVVTIPITSHHDGDTIGGNVTFTADVLGDGQPLNRTMLRVNWSLTPVGGGTGSSSSDTTRPFEFSFGTGMAPDGLYNLKVTATWLDYSGPLASNTIQVRIHNAPPAPTGVRTEVGGNDVDVFWDPIPGVNQYHVYRDGTKIGSTTGTALSDADRPAGTYRYEVTGQRYNAEGPRSDEAVATVLPPSDTTPPTVTLASNCDGATVHDYITLRPTWSDNQGPVTVTIKVDGQILRGPYNFGASGSFLFDWETQGLSNGTYVMQAIARDGAGNEAVATCNWNVHNPAVTLPFTSHSDGDTVRGTVVIKAEPLGDGQPLVRDTMVVRFDATGPANASDTGWFDKQWSWDTTKVPDGVYTVRAAVTWMGYHRDFGTNAIQLRVDNVDTQAPTAPELTATVADGDDDVDLSWTEATDDRGVASYRLYRNGVLYRTLAASARSFRDVDVAVGTSRYTIRATDHAGKLSPDSNEVTVTIAEDTEPPTAPVLTATVEDDGVHLSWTESTDRGPFSYEVYRYYDRDDRIAELGQSTREYVDRTTLPEATYRYRILARDRAGNYVNSSWVDVRIGEEDLEPPTAPELTVVSGGLGATLTWTESTDDRGLKEYAVYRNGTAVQFLPPTWREAGFTLPAGTYTFKVRAIDKAQKLSEFSNEVTVTLAAPTTHAPSISAATLALDNNDVRVSWGEAIGNAPISEYRVYRDDNLIKTVGASAERRYWDVNMPPGTYRYRVVAVDTAGGTLTSGVSSETIAPDTSAPAATLSTTCGTVQGIVDVRGTITDDRGPFAWRLELDGQTIAGPFAVTEPTASIQRAWDTTSAAVGSHVLTLVARDEGGNETETAPCTVNVIPSGLVAAYGFEHTSGTTATDSSGKGSTGTIAGATSAADGKFGRALSFDGTNDLVTAADSNALDLQPGMTLEAWVKPSTVSDWRTVLLKERPGQLAYALYAATDSGRPMTEIAVSGMREARGPSALPVGVWSHLAATYDGANVRLYVNGTQVASSAATGTLFNSAGALRIGGNTVWGEYFSGLIDEVRVYERALSAAEIQGDRDRAVVPGT